MNPMNHKYGATASEHFEELANIPASLPIKKKYATLQRVLGNAVNLSIEGTSLKFTGLFSKMQYLARERKMHKSVVLAANDLRTRLRNLETLTDEELDATYPADLKALCKFIACLYEDATIPEALARRFPTETEKQYRQRIKDALGDKVDCVRCIVNKWDRTHIYVTMESNGEEATVDYSTRHAYNLGEDWSYVEALLSPGSQLNLVRPRIENEIIYPELIIFQPDYLVNVTTIAGCFEEYGDSYLMNLVNKIKPSACTAPILLGNFAGQLLDESAYRKHKSYKESIWHFFKKNALSFACCTDPLIKFHEEAKRQKHVIENIFGNEQLAHQKDGRALSPDELILEPTYFCETLGLQGRLDFIHYNYDTIIEQKSGSCAWSKIPNRVLQKQAHYVQLLLYRAIFHYAYRKIDYNHLASWLFYSKYPNGLLELGSAPKLLFEALKIRNQIVWSEMQYAEEGMGMLETLRADQIFPKQRDEAFLKWHRQRIDQLLGQVSKASELERAYYLRFMRFIAREHALSKMGNKEKEDAGFASLWNSSLQERKDAGNIYDHLSMLPLSGDDEVELVRFSLDETIDQDASNFRAGDIVVFYPYVAEKEPKVTESLVFRGTITDIQIGQVEVRLRNAQNRKVFDCIFSDYKARRTNLSWALEHDFMEASYSSLYRGLQAFLTANQDRKDLILGQRKPRTDAAVKLNGDYGNEEFNELALRAKQAQDIFLIVGPPGTGKTSYGMLNVLQEHLTEPDTSVLVMAYTNRAVDEICSKLVEQGLDFIRIGSEQGCGAEYRPYLLDKKVEAMENMTIDNIRTMMVNTRIFCGTTTSFNGKTDLFGLKKFDLAIIDEASQILEPYVIGLLSATHMENGKRENAIAKMVLIGDEKQLPAVVQQDERESVVDDPLLQGIGLKNCRLSLFERLEALLGKQDARYCHVLTHQGRMHPDIARFPNQAFYQGKLKPVPLPHQLELTASRGKGQNGIEDLLLTHRVAFLCCSPREDANESDKTNATEAKMIAATVIQGYLMMKEHFDVNESIGVIVPYRNQISSVRNMIDRMSLPLGIHCLHDITIDTVERYQGSQRDLIVYGFTVKKAYQLNFLTNNTYYDENEQALIDRKLNVAMTRARKNLVMVGNDRLLAQDPVFSKLMEYCKCKQGFFRIDSDSYAEGRFSISDCPHQKK